MTTPDPNIPSPPSLLRAIMDAIHGEDDALAGVSVTRLTTHLSADESAEMNVETTLRFGRFTDLDPLVGNPADAMVIVGGEIIYCNGVEDYKFLVLERGLDGSTARSHPAGTLVYDFSQNRSAVDQVRRGIFVRTAQGVDLDVVGRNLGVQKCPNLAQEEWRQIIELTAYMPKSPVYSFEQVLDVVFPGQYTILEKPSEPETVTVLLDLQATNSKRGKFLLNGGERHTVGSANQVITNYPIAQVLSVKLDTPLERMGFGGTDLFGAGSFGGQAITLGTATSPGTPVIVNYGAFAAHYLAADEDVRDDNDMFAYLSDSTQLAACLLDHVRAAGVRVKVAFR